MTLKQPIRRAKEEATVFGIYLDMWRQLITSSALGRVYNVYSGTRTRISKRRNPLPRDATRVFLDDMMCDLDLTTQDLELVNSGTMYDNGRLRDYIDYRVRPRKKV